MSKMKPLFLFAVVAGAMLFASVSTSAQTTAIVTGNGNCLIAGADRGLYVFKCTDGGIRYNIRDGKIMVDNDTRCLDHGVVRGANPGNDQRHVKFVGCHGGDSQVWYLHKATSPNDVAGLIQNKANPDVCLNIEGGNDKPGTRVLVWGCGFRGAGANERFYIGGKMTSTQFAGLEPAIKNILNGGGSVTMTNGARMVAAGGGNMVAAGAGNMVAAGAGNLASTAAGSMVAAGGGNLAAEIIRQSQGTGFRRN